MWLRFMTPTKDVSMINLDLFPMISVVGQPGQSNSVVVRHEPDHEEGKLTIIGTYPSSAAASTAIRLIVNAMHKGEKVFDLIPGH